MKERMRKVLAAALAFLVLAAALPAAAVTAAGCSSAAFAQEGSGASAEKVQATRVKIKAPKKKMTAGEKMKLKAVVTPSKASQKVKWTSGNKKIATVNSKGVVTARKAGKVTITATARDGSGKKARIQITVRKTAPTPEPTPETDPLPQPETSSEPGTDPETSPDPGTDPGTDPETTAVKYFALLIGNGNYTESKKLHSVYNDVRAMKAMLEGLSQQWSITSATDLTADGIRKAIRNAFNGAAEEDVCLFYYSGQGVVADAGQANDEKQGALVGVDEKLFLGSQLANALSEATTGHVIVLLDSNGSGSMVAYRKGKEGKGIPTGEAADPGQFVNGIRDSFSYFDRQEGRKGNTSQDVSEIAELRTERFHVITACAYAQKTAELTFPSGGKYGLFTFSLLKSVGYHAEKGEFSGTAPSDTNGDKKLTWTECAVWTANCVEVYKKELSGITMEVCGYSKDGSYILFAR